MLHSHPSSICSLLCAQHSHNAVCPLRLSLSPHIPAAAVSAAPAISSVSTAIVALRLAQLHQQALGSGPSGCFPGQHASGSNDVPAQGAADNSGGTRQHTRHHAHEGDLGRGNVEWGCSSAKS